MIALAFTAWLAFNAGLACGAAWCAFSVARKLRR